MATFETDGFSKFAFVKKVSSSGGGNGGDESGGDTATKYTFKASVKEYIGVADVGTISENDAVVDLSEGREVANGTKITLTATAKSGYALKGWYKVEGTSETLISCVTTYEFTVNEDMVVKAVFDEKVTVQIESQGLMLGGGSSLGRLIMRIKGVEKSKYSGFKMEVAKGTEVTIEMIPCAGTAFKDWSYRDPCDIYSSLSSISTNLRYTFIAEKKICIFMLGETAFLPN